MDQESSLLNNLMSFRPGNTASRCIYGIDLWTYVL
jgi:hypothetical protein